MHYNVLNNIKCGQNPKSFFFLQYAVLFRTPSLPFRAYLVHFVRQFLFCNQPSGFWLKLQGYLTRFSGHFAPI